MGNLLIVIIVFMFASCGSSQHALKGGKAPSWANRAPGGWVCEFEGKQGLCSMGMVTGVKGDASMRRTAAAERARAGLQRLFDTYTAALFKSYQAATTEFHDAAEEQHVEQVLKTFAMGHLSGVEIKDYWENEGNDAFALAFLDMSKFLAEIEKIGDLNAKTRELIKGHADKAFKELREEEERGVSQ